jgi:hypothetical protein
MSAAMPRWAWFALVTVGGAACATVAVLARSIARSSETTNAAAAVLSAESSASPRREQAYRSPDGAIPLEPRESLEFEDLETGIIQNNRPDGTAEDEARWVLARLVVKFRLYVNNQKSFGAVGVCQFPASTPPIPASFSQLAGGRYASTPAEWQDAGFAGNQLGFRIPFPQRNQYRWDNESGAGTVSGHFTAVLDRNGDGTPDAEFAMKLTCEQGFRCIQLPMTKRMWR